jgi:hypothetical protein
VNERRRAAVDWRAVETLMGRCVRGQGIVLQPDEVMTLERARKADPAKYRELHATVKDEAVQEITLTSDGGKRGAT